MAIFNLSLQKGCVPEELKIARVTPIYKADDVNDIVNYIPISVLPCFSKILERIMYNRLFKYLKSSKGGDHYIGTACLFILFFIK